MTVNRLILNFMILRMPTTAIYPPITSNSLRFRNIYATVGTSEYLRLCNVSSFFLAPHRLVFLDQKDAT
jgi:hypothetical protein